MTPSGQSASADTSMHAFRCWLPVVVSAGVIVPGRYRAAGVPASVAGWTVPAGSEFGRPHDRVAVADDLKPGKRPAGFGFEPMPNNFMNFIDMPVRHVDSDASVDQITDRVVGDCLDSPPSGPPE